MAASAGSVHLISSMTGREGPGHAQISTTLKDHHSQSSANWPPEAHNQSQLKQLLQGHSATLHTSSPHFLCGRGNYIIATTSASNHRQLPSSRMVPSITPAYSASLNYSLTFGLLAGFKGHHRIRDTPTYRRGQVLGSDVQALAREATPNRKQ